LFADEGELAMTEIFFPGENFNLVKLKVNGGAATIKNGIVYQLRPASKAR
jgi:hypothetical protein